MRVAANKEAAPTDRVPDKLAKESLRNGLSEYGRQFSGGTQVGSTSVNVIFGGQLFFGSEITLLEPISSHSPISQPHSALMNSISSKTDETKNEDKFPKLTNAFETTSISTPQVLPTSNPFSVNGKTHIGDDNFSQKYKTEQEWLSQLSLEKSSSFQADVNLANENIYIDRSPPLRTAPNADAEMAKQLPFKTIPTPNPEQQKFLMSEPTTASSSLAKASWFMHLKSNHAAIIKSTDENIGDTLFSENLTTLDAKYFSQVEFIIYSGENNATLIGNSSDNTLVGGVGNDTLIGSRGNDQLIGGAGDDIFVFSINDGYDQIIDFASGDRIQFRGAAFLNQLQLGNSEVGQQIQFGQTTVEILGSSELVLGTDWIMLSR